MLWCASPLSISSIDSAGDRNGHIWSICTEGTEVICGELVNSSYSKQPNTASTQQELGSTACTTTTGLNKLRPSRLNTWANTTKATAHHSLSLIILWLQLGGHQKLSKLWFTTRSFAQDTLRRSLSSIITWGNEEEVRQSRTSSTQKNIIHTSQQNYFISP